MLKNIFFFIKKHPFSFLIVVFIWYLSLFNPPKINMNFVPFVDKWTHIAMYFTLVFVLLIEDFRISKLLPNLLRIVMFYLIPILMSGIIELIQAYFTTNRSGEWLDFYANAIGGIIGVLLAFITLVLYLKRKK